MSYDQEDENDRDHDDNGDDDDEEESRSDPMEVDEVDDSHMSSAKGELLLQQGQQMMSKSTKMRFHSNMKGGESLDGLINASMDGRMHGSMDGCMDRWMYGWIDAWMDRCMDG